MRKGGDQMLDLILRSRLDVLKRNLEQIQNSLSFQQKHQECIKRLEQLVNSNKIERSKIDLRNKIAHTSKFLIECESIELCPLKNDRSKIQKELLNFNDNLNNTINGIFDEVKDIAKNIQKIHSQIDEKLSWIFETDLMKEVDNLIIELQNIEQSLNRRETDEPSLLTNWTKLQQIEKDSEDLFDEYVDFLRGIAMRDAGLDLSLCDFAEELIEEIIINPIQSGSYKSGSYKRSLNWRSLVILSRRERMSKSVAKLLRIGYPEWTVWALPLIVSDFGHLVLSENEKILKKSIQDFKARIKQQQDINQQSQDDWTEEELRYLIVDAYATYALGPAYVWAVIVLRFNPSSAYQKKENLPSDSQRFQVMLAMLRRMNQDVLKKLNRESYSEMINTLKSEWETALQQAQSHIPPLTQDNDKSEKLIEVLWAVFRDLSFTKYPSDEWIKIKEDLFKCLNDNQNRFLKNPKLHTRITAHVLNAAWWCRIDHPENTDNIAENTLFILNQIVFMPPSSTNGEFDSRKSGNITLV